MKTQAQNTQNSLILAYLQDGNSLTPMQALQRFSCWRLAARIAELRAKDYNIHTKLIEKETAQGKKVFAQYFMDVEKEGNGQLRIRDINK